MTILQKFFYPLTLCLFLIPVAVITSLGCGEFHIRGGKFALPTNGTKLIPPAPLLKNRSYSIVISSTHSLMPIYNMYYKDESYLFFFGDSHKRYLSSSILLDGRTIEDADRPYKRCENCDDDSLRFSYTGKGGFLTIQLARDFSSAIGASQVSIELERETLADQWERIGTPGWFWGIVAVVALAFTSIILSDMSIHRKRRKRELEQEQRLRSQAVKEKRRLEFEAVEEKRRLELEAVNKEKEMTLRQKAIDLSLRAHRESNFLDTEFQRDYARTKHKEILDSTVSDLRGLNFWISRLSSESQIFRSGARSENIPTHRYKEFIDLLSQIDELKHIHKMSLKDAWSVEYDRIRKDADLVLLLEKEYPSVIEWLEARQAIVRLAEQYAVKRS